MMKENKTINELIESLNNVKEGESYLTPLKNSKISIDEIEKYYTWSQDSYTRNCLSKTDKYELLLICYEKGQQTPIHDFSTQSAWIHTIHGELREERFKVKTDEGKGLEQISLMTLGTKEYSYMNGSSGIHRYINVYESRSVSLNLYAKPVEYWNEYNEITGVSMKKKVSHDAIYV